MENGYNNGSSNNDYQFTRPENNASNYGGGYNNSGLDMTPMTMGEWIVTLINMAIPCLNIYHVFCLGIRFYRQSQPQKLLPRVSDHDCGRLRAVSHSRREGGGIADHDGKQQRILLLKYRCIRETEISIRK